MSDLCVISRLICYCCFIQVGDKTDDAKNKNLETMVCQDVPQNLQNVLYFTMIGMPLIEFVQSIV